MARLPERPAEVVLQSEPELIIRLLEHSLKSLHYLFVLFFPNLFWPPRRGDRHVHLVGVGASVGGGEFTRRSR